MTPLLGQKDPRWRVIYPDGKRSERMDKSTAKEYASMFGGKVIKDEPVTIKKGAVNGSNT